ncbi:unnamed protein product [Closterium sp. Naga37s-1]|nr:unnamed protein product [Closterium sp. Naga37s-1]
MNSSQAGYFAKQGLSMLYNATVTSVSAIATGINKAYQTYTDYYERDQIEALKKSGKRPADNLYLVLQRFQYLCMAGYDNELAAAAQKAATKLTAGEKSSVALETLLLLTRVLTSVSQRYGEQSGQGWGLQDFLNSSRMGKDHFDRDQLVIDFYFAILFVQDVCGGPGPQFEQAIREATGRLVEGDKYVGEGGGFSGGGAAFGGASSSVPSYAAVPSASALPSDQDPKKKAMKVVQVLSQAVRKAAEDADGRKQRSLKEAEEMLRRENEKAAAAAGVAYAGPPAKPLSSFGGGASAAAPVGGYGSAGGMAAKPSGVSAWSGGSGAAAAAPSPWGGGGGSALGGPVGGTMGGGAGGSAWGGGGSANVGGAGGFGGGSGGGGGGWGGSASTGGGGGAWGAGGGQAGGSAGGWGGTTGGSTTGGSSGWGTGTGGSLI